MPDYARGVRRKPRTVPFLLSAAVLLSVGWLFPRGIVLVGVGFPLAAGILLVALGLAARRSPGRWLGVPAWVALVVVGAILLVLACFRARDGLF